MKRLLSILAAVGLTATASTAAVSCSIGGDKTQTVEAHDMKIDVNNEKATWTETITLRKGLSAHKSEGKAIIGSFYSDDDTEQADGWIIVAKKDAGEKDLEDNDAANKIEKIMNGISIEADEASVPDEDITEGSLNTDIKNVKVTFTYDGTEDKTGMFLIHQAIEADEKTLNWTLLEVKESGSSDISKAMNGGKDSVKMSVLTKTALTFDISKLHD